MLAEGKITTDEAERLLAALDKEASATATTASLPGTGSSGSRVAPKYLRVMIDDLEDSAKPTKVNVRVPLQLVRAGVKLGALLSPEAREKVNGALGEKGIGIDLNQVTAENIDALIEALSDMTVDIDAEGGQAKVKVFCE
jgi:hypothetical protein